MIAISSRREGFALVGAVLAMLVVGAVVTGGFYAANQQSQVVRSAYLGEVAQYIAETGLEATMARVNGRRLNQIAVNNVETLYSNVSVTHGGKVVGRYTTTVLRTQGSVFLVRSTGTVTIGGASSGAQRTVANVVRLRKADFDNQTAMQVFGDLDVAGTADINGNDTYRAEWTGESCSTTGGTSAVTAPTGARITETGSGDIVGPITNKPLTGNDFLVFGDLTWDDVTAMATSVYEDGESPKPAASCTPGSCLAIGATCNAADRDNWGTPRLPTHPCFAHFPIIWAKGNMLVNANGAGQGILLVEGDLDLMGQFEFYGPIVVKGTVFFRGGSQAFGSVFAFGGGVVGQDNQLAGNMIVQYSSCSIERAVLGANGLSRGLPIRNRSWFDVTNVQASY